MVPPAMPGIPSLLRLYPLNSVCRPDDLHRGVQRFSRTNETPSAVQMKAFDSCKIQVKTILLIHLKASRIHAFMLTIFRAPSVPSSQPTSERLPETRIPHFCRIRWPSPLLRAPRSLCNFLRGEILNGRCLDPVEIFSNGLYMIIKIGKLHYCFWFRSLPWRECNVQLVF